MKTGIWWKLKLLLLKMTYQVCLISSVLAFTLCLSSIEKALLMHCLLLSYIDKSKGRICCSYREQCRWICTGTDVFQKVSPLNPKPVSKFFNMTRFFLFWVSLDKKSLTEEMPNSQKEKKLENYVLASLVFRSVLLS